MQIIQIVRRNTSMQRTQFLYCPVIYPVSIHNRQEEEILTK